ncbi:MAG: hypothetical protein GYB68_00215 [Chloroflexi bacterium]|nr:hypothetical protein [Chloroflexota bacterium]
MNSIIEDEFPGSTDLRDQLLDLILDEDLAYRLPGQNPSFGELCVEMGQTQQIYIHSFKTLQHDRGYRGILPDDGGVKSLRVWFAALDKQLIEALSSLSEDDVHNKEIDRGKGFVATPFVQFQIYHEALLIFYAKASVYLKALEKEMTEQWREWIG